MDMTLSALLAALLALWPASDVPATWASELAEWRRSREADLKKEDGYLAVAGLYFLHTGSNTVGSDPQADVALPADAAPAVAGRIVVSGGAVEYHPAAGMKAQVNGRLISRPMPLRLADSEAARPADLLTLGRLTLHLHLSGERLAVRVRDPQSESRRSFTKLEWFDPDPAWRITGQFLPFDAARPVPIENILGDVADSTAPGEIDATIGGARVRLLALSAARGRLWIVFTDLTADKLTYRIRFLYTDPPDASGTVVLDFNRAYNAPCAYNPYTTCPLPPRQNKLAVAVPVGERNYTGPKPRAPGTRG
jgi:uncharacterized protein (DUF1684 family)